MSTPNIGRMRDRVAILRRGKDILDANGNATKSYSTVRTIWAMKRHQSDREYTASGGPQVSRMVYFTFRTQKDLRADDVLECDGVRYQIEERHPLDDYALYERIRATQVVAEGRA